MSPLHAAALALIASHDGRYVGSAQPHCDCGDCGPFRALVAQSEKSERWPWLAEAIRCCDSWEPEARLIGNVPAKDLGDMLRALVGEAEKGESDERA